MSDFNMPPGVSARDIPGNDDDTWREEGDMQAMAVMTLRDYFAAKAMFGFLSGKHHEDQLCAVANINRTSNSYYYAVAEISYAMADAMLHARMKP
jgi:hypothetical protein